MRFLKTFIILITFTFVKQLFACDNSTNALRSSNISTWLGNTSPFLKAYKDGKCVLDEALVNIHIGQRKIIANLITKSYILEIKKAKEDSSYSY